MSSRLALPLLVWALTAVQPGRWYLVHQRELNQPFLSLSPVSSSYYGRNSPPPRAPTRIVDGRVGWWRRFRPTRGRQRNGWLTPAPVSYFRTATMIQGPSDAVVLASFPQIQVSLSCALNSGMADCVGEVKQPGKTMTTSLRETVKPYLVQGGGSGGGSPAPTPAPSGSGNDSGSAVTTAVMCAGMLVGSVFAGTVTLFLV